MKSFFKFILIFIISTFGYQESISAKINQENEINFEINPKNLKNDSIQFAYFLGPSKNFFKNFPELKNLDRFKGLRKKELQLFASKSAFIIDRPFGFFGHDLSQDQDFIKLLMGEQKIEKISSNSYLVTVDGKTPHRYSMDIFFDSDEISNSTDSNALKALNSIKKIDIFAKGNASFLIKDLYDFSKYAHSGKDIFIFTPFNQNQSIVIVYHLLFLHKNFAISKPLVRSYIQELEAITELLELPYDPGVKLNYTP